jgi:hypothetical protein
MQTLTVGSETPGVPKWLWAASALGIVWNVYGVYQYVGTFTQAGQAAMTAGMTPEQAAIYLGLPGWMSVVFAVGVFGGLIGSIAMAARRRVAVPVLIASLAGYCLLFAGDAYHGVFDNNPGQLAILAVVVLIAVALLWISRIATRRAFLR